MLYFSGSSTGSERPQFLMALDWSASEDKTPG